MLPIELDDLTLLRLHLEACWNLDLPPLAHGEFLLSATNDGPFPWNRTEPMWRLYVADVAGGNIVLCAPGVDRGEDASLLGEVTAALDTLAEAVPAGIRREVALARRDPPRPLPEAVRCLTRVLSVEDASLIDAFEAGSAPYYNDPHHAPAIGVEVAGRLVTIAHSSRRTDEACELGIDTLPEARRHGYALAATVHWAEMVAAEGLVPLYSASAANVASLALAAAAGYRPFARAAYVPER